MPKITPWLEMSARFGLKQSNNDLLLALEVAEKRYKELSLREPTAHERSAIEALMTEMLAFADSETEIESENHA